MRTNWGEDVGVQSRAHSDRLPVLQFIRSILEDRDGVLWFGGGGGVSRYDGTDWQFFTEDDGLANNWANSMYQASDGAMWFGMGDWWGGAGVSRYDGSWQTFTVDDGLLFCFRRKWNFPLVELVG